jgi:Zn-dependent M28 family amino/carboxypeptidase
MENYNLWFCIFSAEELGTMGSRNFLDKYGPFFKKGTTYQFNFDMVSVCNPKKNRVEYIKSYGFIPKKRIAPFLKHKLKQAASYLKINLIGFGVPIGAHTDSIPFHLKKFDSVDLTTRGAAKYTHCREDTIDKVDASVLSEAFFIVKNSILSFN